ncbi:MAG: hypothetical protein HYT98_05315 [Candidatus Sungbacteria bacterium]|nr:hypothetical protein [Candidatus Sungbacteria bacterium]
MDFEGHITNLSKDDRYFKAREVIEPFLGDLDPELRVEVEDVEMVYENGDSYVTPILHFYHNLDPEIDWSMEIGDGEDYLEKKFESEVRNAYLNMAESKTIH